MRKQLVLIIGIILSSQQFFAQALPQGGIGGCVIKYDYDAAGNRIKRSKYCWAGGGNNQRPAPEVANKVTDVEMLVYPNPASTSFTVTFNRDIYEAVVELQDATGKLIAKKQVAGNVTYFNIQNLAQGPYFVVLKRKDTKASMVRKVIKE